MTRTIGIDIGTSSSAVAIDHDTPPTILTTVPEEHITSHSLTSAGHHGQHPPALAPILQLVGRSFEDPVVQFAREQATFEVHRGPGNAVMVALTSQTRAVAVEDLVTKMFRRLKERSESYLGAGITRTVLAVPAHFDREQQRVVRHAAEKAGLAVLRIFDAPTTAALAFAKRHENRGRKLLLVVDLDEGHFDASLLKLEGTSATVLAHEGDATLGHATWAALVADYLAQGFLRQRGIDLRHDAQVRQRLLLAAEKASMQLQETDRAVVDLPFITSGVHGPHHLYTTLTRTMYDTQTASLRTRLERAMANVIRAAGVEFELIGDVLLLGKGAAQIALRDVVRRLVPEATLVEDDRRELVVLGAALQATRSTESVNHPDGQVATRLGLGLETVGGLMTTVIPRDTPLPAHRVEIFSTSEDGQTDIEISILQGERPLAADNRRLGVVHVQGIPEAPRGAPQIEVTFEISSDGTLQVIARDLATETSESLTVDINETIGDGEAQRLVQEARAHELDDRRKRALVESHNLGRQAVYQAKRYLQHLNGVPGHRGCEWAKREVEGKLHALQEAVAAQDVQRIHRLTGELQAVSNTLNALVYGQTGADATSQIGAGELDYLQIFVEEL